MLTKNYHELEVVVCFDNLKQTSLISRPEPLLFLSSSSSIVLTRLVAPGIEPATSGFVARNPDH
jgi:hypothetical protein